MDRISQGRRAVLACLASAAASLSPVSLLAQSGFPSRPAKFVVPFPPGGTNDTLARMLGQKLSAAWGQPVVIDNRAGANGAIGTDFAAKSPADGYTMLMTSDTHIITPLLAKTSYDAIADFAPVAVVATTELLLVLNKDVPANNLQEFIALLKSAPGKVNFASPGNGNSLHLAGELFGVLTATKMVHVPYKGAGPAVTDLLGGQVQSFFSPPINVVQHVKAGRLKAIAVSGPRRLSTLPEVSTFAEAGLQNFDVRVWQGIFMPANTPKDVVDRIAADIEKVLADEGVKSELAKGGMDSGFIGPAQFAGMLRADTAKYRNVITKAMIKID